MVLFFVLLWGLLLWRWCKRRQEMEEQMEAGIAVEAVAVVEAARAVIAEEGSGFHVTIAVKPTIEGVQGEIDGI